MTSPRRSLCAMVLCVEAIVLGLTTPVMIAVADVSTGTALAVGLGLAAGCLVVAGLLRAEWGYWLGHLVQVAAVGLGFVIPLMFVLGLVLAALWVAAFAVGRKIERDRAAYAASAENGAEHESAPGA
ncbi:DUF4233 domain-containing protein [Nocardioides antri]|uniref:DUF4233 domain-containing protein n=1 Tax=Nocardioides antri TaxID=2607659 RepID=A0A5B1M1S0_9ACTN|nr:DUF4233 domain-containing protein [Nocardioides antri]KAA1425757.1 DUF4233 domain-containing protein [Nocardioides antri]